ncbi:MULTISPECIES: histidine kinase [unclassified Amycolatopsis]|uniref:sensor histidine kinase n=1 Tax=unclassified Amycolatopsis TaxID=2618356 RepID=UPI002874CF36|nr:MULTISPECIES: histidine kinase [unclassified Amycolatopsis]MDS0135865.1 two-component sensor histidine kinase [Amycolatopsis sp. 505]MDS0145546.1 two-component sensor histidine kinase [Amycolatopsis sp. CM201R]
MPKLRRLRDRWAGVTPQARDGALAAAVTVAAFVPGLDMIGAQFGDLPRHDGGVLAVALVLGQTLPLAARSRWPAATLLIIATCFAAHEVLAYAPTIGSLALYFALYSAGAREERFRRALPAAASAEYVAFAVLATLRGSPSGPLVFVLYYGVLVLFWLLGALVRQRRRQEAERRRLTALAAAADERARLARELHDVVTHHVTAMVVQADAAQYLPPDSVPEVLAAITGSGRNALTELRFLLGVLEATGARTPGLSALRGLVEQPGRTVELVEEGERPALPPETELTAYRVVQEALTNAAKYAAGRPATVHVGYRADLLEIEVSTQGPATAPGALGSGGRGLTGLRDRVDTLGGRFTAGPSADGFRVRAEFPTAGIPAAAARPRSDR